MTALQLQGISKAFPGVKALDAVDFSVQAGEIHALLGENGAGKSTLIKVITGVYSPDAGSLSLNDKSLDIRSTGQAQAAGISTVYQEVNLVPNLSVAHNLFFGREPMRFGCIHHRRMQNDARALLASFKLDIDVACPLGQFPVAVQQLVAIARGVSASAGVLILDEPTASLDKREVDTLFSLLDELRSKGMAIIFVTHFLDQVYRLCDRITVLRNGRRMGCWATAELDRNALVAQMLGKELMASEQVSREADTDTSSDWLKAVNISVRRSLLPLDLVIARGEAVGLAGLLGSGRTELCRALFGLDVLDSGHLEIEGKKVSFSTPADAVHLGMALCPEDRKVAGICGPLSVEANLLLALQAQRGWFRPLGKTERKQLVERMIRELDIRVSGASGQTMEQLSGGNQQKVILARWLLTEPTLMILDEPTRGIDVGAHAEIIRLVQQLCEQGMALIVTSSELEELVMFADRVLVMRERRKVAELTGQNISETQIMAAIASDEHEESGEPYATAG